MPARKRYFKQLVDILLFHKGKDEENKRERTKVVERIINGQGTHWLSDGGKYVGEFKNGKFNGQGTITFLDGNKYVGEFKDGKLNGQGTVTFPDGGVKRGMWKNNKIEKFVE